MSEQTITAAKFYLKSQGQTGTAKQVAKLTAQFDADTILRLAIQRGYAVIPCESMSS